MARESDFTGKFLIEARKGGGAWLLRSTVEADDEHKTREAVEKRAELMLSHWNAVESATAFRIREVA